MVQSRRPEHHLSAVWSMSLKHPMPTSNVTQDPISIRPKRAEATWITRPAGQRISASLDTQITVVVPEMSYHSKFYVRSV